MSTTRLKPGLYVMTITGPAGDPVYTQSVEMGTRGSPAAWMDDEHAEELLQVTSMASGLVEAEMMRMRQVQGMNTDDTQVVPTRGGSNHGC